MLRSQKNSKQEWKAIFAKKHSSNSLWTAARVPSFRSKILDKHDPRFSTLNCACDNVYRRLRAQGVGTEVRHAQAITGEEEKLCLSSVINVTTPKGLQRAMFYYVGKVFCIGDGQEQRNLGRRFVALIPIVSFTKSMAPRIILGVSRTCALRVKVFLVMPFRRIFQSVLCLF